MTEREWHGPTPFLRLVEDGGKEIAEVPMIFLFVRRKGPKKQNPIKWYHTNWKGRLCRWKKTEDPKKLVRGVRYEKFGTYVPINPRGKYEGFACGEICFRRDKIQHVNLVPLSMAVSGGNLCISWSPPKPKFCSMESTILHFLESGVKSGVLGSPNPVGGNGIPRSDYEEYLELLQKTLKSVLLDRRTTIHMKTESFDETCDGIGVVNDIVKNPSEVEKTLWDVWKQGDQVKAMSIVGGKWYGAIENVYLHKGALDLQELMGGQSATDDEDQVIRRREQVWKLSAEVEARTDLGYNPADHTRYAWDLQNRFKMYMKEMGKKEKKHPAEIAAEILDLNVPPQAANWPHNSLLATSLRDDSIARVDPAAIKKCLAIGDSSRSFDASIAEGLSKAAPDHKLEASGYDFQIHGSAPIKERMAEATARGYVEIPIGSVYFAFATGHWIYDFNLVSIERRVRAWWDSVPKDVRRRLAGGRILFDSYASQLGDENFNNWLSRQRLKHVVNSVKTCLAKDQRLAGVDLVAQSHGQVLSSNEAPPPDILNSVEVFESKGLYNALVTATQDNPWYHRVVTVQLLEHAPIPKTEDGKVDLQVLRQKLISEGSYPIKQATPIAAVKVLEGDSESFRTLVFITPGKRILVGGSTGP